jgi:hypothetical protein
VILFRLLSYLACALALVILAGNGCTLVTDADDLSRGCPDGTKLCEGQCVSISDKDYGCDSSSCSPCALSRAAARCNSEGQCVIASCVGAYEDCDRLPENGCEVNTDRDKDNCGGCGEVCEDPYMGEASCGKANCYVRVCQEPYADCNEHYEDGCEVKLSSSDDRCED